MNEIKTNCIREKEKKIGITKQMETGKKTKHSYKHTHTFRYRMWFPNIYETRKKISKLFLYILCRKVKCRREIFSINESDITVEKCFHFYQFY